MSKFFTMLTKVGEAKLANATALGQTVQFEKLAVGDGDGVLPTPDQNQTALINEVRREPLNAIEIDPNNPNWIICEQIIPEDVGGWTIREVGIYDVDGDLIAVGNFPETYKPILEEGSGRTQTVRIVLQVSSSSTVELKIDPSIVLATRKYVDDKDAAHIEKYNPHPQYPLSTYVHFLPYDANRIYKCGEVCYTDTGGKISYWEWYSNSESLSGKDPLDVANRQSGWTDDTKPFYWAPYKKSRPGTPLFPWMSMTFPEGTLNVLGNSVPVAVFWRLAEALPEFVNATTGMIDFPETGGEFFRVLDQGRGIDPAREFGSYQKATIVGWNTGTDSGIYGMNLNKADTGVLEMGADEIDTTEYTDVTLVGGNASSVPLPGSSVGGYAGASRSRNLAFPILVEV